MASAVWKICVICESKFTNRHGRCITCSEECSVEHHRRQCRAREFKKYHDNWPASKEAKRVQHRNKKSDLQLIARGKDG